MKAGGTSLSANPACLSQDSQGVHLENNRQTASEGETATKKPPLLVRGQRRPIHAVPSRNTSYLEMARRILERVGRKTKIPPKGFKKLRVWFHSSRSQITTASASLIVSSWDCSSWAFDQSSDTPLLSLHRHPVRFEQSKLPI